jgi:hypothetical protein
LNLIQSFKKKFNLTINEEVLNMLTTKRKAPSPSIDQSKKLKTTHSNEDNNQLAVDCRQIPFKGISIQT